MSSIFLIFTLYTSFLTTSLFTTLLSLIKLTGTGANLSMLNLSTLPFKLLKSSGTVFNLSTAILSTSAFKLTWFDFSAKPEVSI